MRIIEASVTISLWLVLLGCSSDDTSPAATFDAGDAAVSDGPAMQ